MRRLVATAVGAVLLLLAPAGGAAHAERDDVAEILGAVVIALTRVGSVLDAETTRSQDEPHHGAGVPREHQPDQRPTDLTSREVTPRAAWQWPLAGRPEVVKPFDPPEERWLPGHRGIDLAGLTYAPVLAVAEGTVTHSGSIAGIGTVSITHADGIRSTYQPVTERIEEGERVAAGDRIGYLGAIGSHCLLRTCLHLGAVRGTHDYLDPLLFLEVWELTLLPHEH